MYSLFISSSTLSDPACTGMCRKLYTLGWSRISPISCQVALWLIAGRVLKKSALLLTLLKKITWALTYSLAISSQFEFSKFSDDFNSEIVTFFKVLDHLKVGKFTILHFSTREKEAEARSSNVNNYCSAGG